MKNIIIASLLTITALSACKSSDSKSKEEKQTANSNVMDKSDPGIVNPADTTTIVKEIVAGYLQLKNELAKDNGIGAAAAGNSVVAIIDKTDKKDNADLIDDIREHVEHIGANGGDIAHQREHFEMLSKDIYDLVKTKGAGQSLYKDFCPMYNKNKGAFWISESKEIKNPYLGKAMPSCGIVKEEIKE
jgi:hypothetical protein